MHPATGNSRRRLLRGIAAVAVALPLTFGAAACGDDNEGSGSTDANKPVELSVFYWGSEKRAELTQKALDAYKAKNPNVSFKVTWQANQGYADKLATLAASGDVPDLFATDDNMLADFATRNVTADLTSYKGNKLDLSKFPPSLVEYGTVDGKLVGIAAGENTQGLVYNKTLLTSNGLPEPTTGMTWEAFIDWSAQVTAKTKVPGTMDPSADYKAFWVWLRQQGKDLYNGKQLGFTADDVAKWFTLWKGARDRKATPTADIIHEGNVTDISKQLVVTGKAATSWVWANQMPELKKSTKDDLGVIAYPGDPSAQWARAAMYWNVANGSDKKDVAVDVINFLVNDEAAVTALGTDRGLPSNTDLRAKFAETVTDPAMKLSIQVENDLASKFGKAPQVPPKGHSTFRSELVKAAENVQFGRATPEKAAADLIAVVQPKLG
jgi:multiple sugar transport system substrate-binding protein